MTVHCVCAQRGALVAGVSTPQLVAALVADGGECLSPVGDLENLSHYVQGYVRLSRYHTPLLVGYSSGAMLAYASTAQAPADTCSGTLSLAFCPHLALNKPMCEGGDLRIVRGRQS
jgi:type IV secretory pathway VirJ component